MCITASRSHFYHPIDRRWWRRKNSKPKPFLLRSYKCWVNPNKGVRSRRRKLSHSSRRVLYLKINSKSWEKVIPSHRNPVPKSEVENRPYRVFRTTVRATFPTRGLYKGLCKPGLQDNDESNTSDKKEKASRRVCENRAFRAANPPVERKNKGQLCTF